MESDAHLESQLTLCALWGRRFTSLGLLPFLEGAASRLVVPVSASYVLSAYHGGGWGAGCNKGGHLDGKATLLRHRCSQSSAALVRGPSPESGAQRRKNLLSLSLSGVKGGLELGVGLKAQEDPHATPLGSQRAFVHVEEKANVHQL